MVLSRNSVGIPGGIGGLCWLVFVWGDNLGLGWFGAIWGLKSGSEKGWVPQRVSPQQLFSVGIVRAIVHVPQ